MARDQQRFVRRWDRNAAGYDAKMDGVERRLFPDSRRAVCGQARGKTLEIAIGTGANLPHYAAEVALTGIDWSEGMLSVARERADALGRRVDLRRADATSLPFETASFDTVVATFAMCCVTDERAALAEALRVVRPEGAILLADHVASTFWPLRMLQRAVDLVSVPLEGEHFARRPVETLRGLGIDNLTTERSRLGVIERVVAYPGR